MAEQASDSKSEPDKATLKQSGPAASTDGQQTTYTGMATSAAGAAAESATNAAVGVKDTMFSMFGGGAKKEKKEVEEGEVDRSGSAKAAKEKEKEKEREREVEAREGGEDGDGVSRIHFCPFLYLSKPLCDRIITASASQWR